jgi:hypothetical protein
MKGDTTIYEALNLFRIHRARAVIQAGRISSTGSTEITIQSQLEPRPGHNPTFLSNLCFPCPPRLALEFSEESKKLNLVAGSMSFAPYFFDPVFKRTPELNEPTHKDASAFPP